MADPLTSSDIIRESFGFGPTSPEERRRAAGAGISPLGTMERQRFERGGGISSMASESEKEAWKAAEVMAGRRDPMELPKAYGGMGERPEATTRRGLRMQQEWDKQRETMLQEQEAAIRQENESKNYELRARDQKIQEDDYYYKRGLLEAEQKLKAQQLSEATSIISGLNQLDPRDPEYQKKRSAIFGNNPLGAADPNVQKVATEYGAANEVYVNSLVALSEQQKKDAEEQAKIQADIVKYDLTPDQQAKMLVPNLPTGVIRFDPNKAKPIIAEAEKAIEGKEETKEKEKESETRFDDYNKAFAAYEGLVGDEQAQPEDVAKARAAVRGAAAVLRIPKVANEGDLRNYQSGDKVLAPDGITIITVP